MGINATRVGKMTVTAYRSAPTTLKKTSPMVAALIPSWVLHGYARAKPETISKFMGGIVMTGLKEIKDDKFIAGLFRKLARQKQVFRASFYAEEQKVRSHMYFTDLRGDEPKIVWLKGHRNNPAGQKARVAFFSRDTFFLFETNVKSSEENVHDLEKPIAVYSAFRRVLPRHQMEDTDSGYICLRGDSPKYRVLDISTQGLSFLSEPLSLQKEEVLRSVVVMLDGVPDVQTDAVVTYRRSEKDGTVIYGLRFVEIGWAPRQQLLAYVLRKNFPRIRFLSDFSEAQIHEIYDGAGYLSLKSRHEMNKNYEHMITTFQKIKEKGQIGTTLAYCTGTRILTVGSILRIYDHTFLGHQLASLPEARLNLKSKTDVYSALADSLVDHQDCKHYVTYFDVHLPWHHEMYEKIGTYINDQNKFIMDSLEFFECTSKDFERGPTVTGYEVSAMESPEAFIGFCTHNMHPLEQGCYAYGRDEFYLPEIGRLYESFGLFVARRLWSVSIDGKTVAFAVSEAYTSGLNLFNLLDMVRLYFPDPQVDPRSVLSALLSHVIGFFSKYDKDTFYVVMKIAGESPSDLEMPGFAHRHSAGRVMASRQGVAEYRAIMSLLAR